MQSNKIILNDVIELDQNIKPNVADILRSLTEVQPIDSSIGVALFERARKDSEFVDSIDFTTLFHKECQIGRTSIDGKECIVFRNVNNKFKMIYEINIKYFDNEDDANFEFEQLVQEDCDHHDTHVSHMNNNSVNRCTNCGKAV